MLRRLDAVLSSLEIIADSRPDDRVDAEGLLTQMRTKKFVYMVVMWGKLLDYLDYPTTGLQSPDVSWAGASRLLAQLRSYIAECSADPQIFASVEQLAEDLALRYAELYCPHGFELVGTSCYVLGNETLSWEAAQVFCDDLLPFLGAYLVEFETDEELTLVTQQLLRCPGRAYWTGGEQVPGSPNVFRWSHTGWLVAFGKWYPGNPKDTEHEDGVFIDCAGRFYDWEKESHDNFYPLCEEKAGGYSDNTRNKEQWQDITSSMAAKMRPVATQASAPDNRKGGPWQPKGDKRGSAIQNETVGKWQHRGDPQQRKQEVGKMTITVTSDRID
ncbi:unnamed protein product [Cyprideis torosa]|uniref:Uncharacterized protein n=1 Tax=Cyprideis torosa TaxID=163714 RepID=A0A7R8ZRH1_9CRUS|nr:unnamed protein product [Cyprideis torosa]CAG0898909.1 unnamed protein product [Cyprideis torosa]